MTATSRSLITRFAYHASIFVFGCSPSVLPSSDGNDGSRGDGSSDDDGVGVTSGGGSTTTSDLMGSSDTTSSSTDPEGTSEESSGGRPPRACEDALDSDECTEPDPDPNPGEAECGDGVVDAEEFCEPGLELGASCDDLGFSGEALGCSASCVYDVTGCDGSPQAPVFEMEVVGIKQIRMTWTTSFDADHYEVSMRGPESSAFQTIVTGLSGTEATVSVPVHLLLRGEVRMGACNDAGWCVYSEPQAAPETLPDAIGYFKAPNTDAEDFFGGATALSADGRTLAVSAAGESSDATGIDGDLTNNLADRSGAVYVYGLEDGQWALEATIKASNAEEGDTFGSSLGLSEDGNTLAIGAHREESVSTGVAGDPSSNGASSAGAVYVYSRQDTAWSEQAYLKASNTAEGDLFGTQLVLSGDGRTLAVSALLEDGGAVGVNGDDTDDSVISAGAVYVFALDDADQWAQQAYLKASNTGALEVFFGYRIALSGDGGTLAVGVPNEASDRGASGDETGETLGGSGAVYLFSRDADVWSQTAFLKADNAEMYDAFGDAVALDAHGMTLAVGASYESSAAGGIGADPDDNQAQFSGAAYLFRRDGQAWTQEVYIKPPAPAERQGFGATIALSGTGRVLAVGSPAKAGPGDESEMGSVYIYQYDGVDWSEVDELWAPNPDAADGFGGQLSISADGTTLAISSIGEDSAQTLIGGSGVDNDAMNSGAVYLY